MKLHARHVAMAALSAAPLMAVAASVMPPALADGCDAAAISSGLGQPVNVVRCYDSWAYVSNCVEGDSTMLAHLAAGGWYNYSGFPSTICQGVAAAEGVPAAELSSFRSC